MPAALTLTRNSAPAVAGCAISATVRTSGSPVSVMTTARIRLPLHKFEHAVRQLNEHVNLVVVAVDPGALGFGIHRNEAVVALPDEQRALGTHHVLLPPHLPKI